MSRFALPILALALLLAACGTTAGTPTAPAPLTLTLEACTANVPVTEAGDGDVRCTPLTLTLPTE